MDSDLNETPRHPGDFLKEILAERGLTQADLGFILGMEPNRINLIVTRKLGISPVMSKALGSALNLSADHFTTLQAAYDHSRADDPDPAVGIRANLMEKYPIREMIRRGWLRDADADGIRSQLGHFFGIGPSTEIPYLTHSAKKTKYEEREILPAQLAWLFRVRQIALSMVVPTYSPRSLAGALVDLQDMTSAPEEARNVPRTLAECGVRYVIVETLPSAKIDGVCLWLDGNSPVIGMSTRFDRVDNYWFVLRHEIEHVLRRHGTEAEIVDELDGEGSSTDGRVPEEERIANAAAADFCVPVEKLESFIRRKHPFYYEKDVLAFSKLNGIHPGLVVGQLQRRLNRYDYLKKYQVKIRHCVLPGAIADGWGQTVPLGES